MSIEPAKAAELLSLLYIERQDNQWNTVVTCLDDLISGRVVSHPELVSAAFGLVDDNSLIYTKIIRRAKKLNNRVGQAGRLEARELAKTAIELALSNYSNYEVAAHTSRVGFNRNVDNKLLELVKESVIKTQSAIQIFNRRQKYFNKLTDITDLEDLQNALILRDNYLHKELLQRDKIHAVTLACIVGQTDPWQAIQEILGPRSSPYPYGYELIATQACLAVFTHDHEINLAKLPELPTNLRTKDTANFPTLSCISALQGGSPVPDYIKCVILPETDYVRQFLLELIFLNQMTKS